ncbi:MAG: FkbM family methyltransferase [Planctomycetota bacterium]
MTQNHRNSLPEVSLNDKLARAIGSSKLLPRKIRATILKALVGTYSSSEGRSFQVTLFGHPFSGATNSHIDWYVYYFGAYDEVGTNLLRFIAKQIERPVFLDIGANEGTHSLAVLDYCDEVHCFEPFPTALQILQQHLAPSKHPKVTIHELGMSTKNESLSFYANREGNLGAGTFEPQDREPDFELKVVNGDEYLAANIPKFDLVKVDVEGHEISVLTGMRQSLITHRPIVLWELNPTDDVKNQNIVDATFPTNYTHFRVGFQGRWTRARPSLRKLTSFEFGNVLSIPNETTSMIAELINP